MNLFKKAFFVFTAFTALLILLACTRMEANNIEDTASTIADFELPTGYSPEFSTSMLGYTVAAYKGQNGPDHLYLIQSEKQSDGKELAKMLAQLVPGAGDPDSGARVIENRTVTVRGQEVTLIISEGVNSENSSYRQIAAAFEGKGGPALLMLSESVEAWDQEAIDEFLASIH